MPITAVSFDWGDTLAMNHGAPYSICLKRALGHLAAACGPAADAAWIRRSHATITAAWSATGTAEQEIDANAVLIACLADIGIESLDEELLLGFYAIFTEALLIFDGVAETLRRLKALGLRIGITSHVPWDGRACRAWWRRHGLFELIDFWSLSSDVGWIKPHPKHYNHAIAGAGCPPEEILHVGDHPERDIIGGKSFGLRTCLKVTSGFYDEQVLDGCPAELRIAHVKELPDLLPNIE